VPIHNLVCRSEAKNSHSCPTLRTNSKTTWSKRGRRLKKRNLCCVLLAFFLVFPAVLPKKAAGCATAAGREPSGQSHGAGGRVYQRGAVPLPRTGAFLGLGCLQDRLTDNSLQALSAWQAKEDRWAAELSGIDSPPYGESRVGDLRLLARDGRVLTGRRGSPVRALAVNQIMNGNRGYVNGLKAP